MVNQAGNGGDSFKYNDFNAHIEQKKMQGELNKTPKPISDEDIDPFNMSDDSVVTIEGKDHIDRSEQPQAYTVEERSSVCNEVMNQTFFPENHIKQKAENAKEMELSEKKVKTQLDHVNIEIKDLKSNVESKENLIPEKAAELSNYAKRIGQKDIVIIVANSQKQDVILHFDSKNSIHQSIIKEGYATVNANGEFSFSNEDLKTRAGKKGVLYQDNKGSPLKPIKASQIIEIDEKTKKDHEQIDRDLEKYFELCTEFDKLTREVSELKVRLNILYAQQTQLQNQLAQLQAQQNQLQQQATDFQKFLNKPSLLLTQTSLKKSSLLADKAEMKKYYPMYSTRMAEVQKDFLKSEGLRLMFIKNRRHFVSHIKLERQRSENHTIVERAADQSERNSEDVKNQSLENGMNFSWPADETIADFFTHFVNLETLPDTHAGDVAVKALSDFAPPPDAYIKLNIDEIAKVSFETGDISLHGEQPSVVMQVVTGKLQIEQNPLLIEEVGIRAQKIGRIRTYKPYRKPTVTVVSV